LAAESASEPPPTQPPLTETTTGAQSLLKSLCGWSVSAVVFPNVDELLISWHGGRRVLLLAAKLSGLQRQRGRR